MKISLPCFSAILLPGVFSSLLMGVKPALSLPPPGDIPEEVLRTEIITQARSPINGKPLTAAEYAQYQVQQESGELPNQISPSIQHLIFLARVRKLIQTISPVRIPIHF